MQTLRVLGFFTVSVFVGLAGIVSLAHAQTSGTPSETADETETGAAEATETDATTFTPPAEVAAEAAAPSESPADETAIRFTSVRLGVSLGGGFFVGAISGGMGGVGVGLGAQLGPLGIMYKFHIFTGYYTTAGASEYFTAAWNTLLVDYRFLKFFEIGGGPSMDFVWNCEAQACQDAGPYFGFEARFAVSLGFIKVGLGIHPTFFPGGALGTMFLYFGI